MSDINVTPLSDPCYQPARERLGVEDKEKYIQEAAGRKVKERRSRKCRVNSENCTGQGEFRTCERKGVECNCCDGCVCPFDE